MVALKLVLFFIFFIGIILISIDVVRTYNKCQDPQIIYRYIPRSLAEEEENPVPLDDLFYDMFNNPTVWVSSFDTQRRKMDVGDPLNEYYVTQI